jgi:hypothetical protein
MFYRQSFPNTDAFGAPKQLSHQIRYSVKYPFNELASLRGSITGRNDRSTFLATDITNMQRKSEYEYWGIGKLEFVYDNTRSKGVNVLFGTRYKIFAEYFNRIEESSKNISVIGLDFRHYIKIHRNLVWANRMAASTSGTADATCCTSSALLATATLAKQASAAPARLGSAPCPSSTARRIGTAGPRARTHAGSWASARSRATPSHATCVQGNKKT